VTPRRTPLIAGNWKMHKTAAEASAFVDDLVGRLDAALGVDVAVCPPFTALRPAVERARGSGLAVMAQNMHHDSSGAFTGEVAPPMLTELDVDGVILGHSERRAHFAETDRALKAKVPAALQGGLVPVLCVGETEEEREAGETERKLRHQIHEDLSEVPADRLADVVVAYEPVWAIGTGRVATPEQAQDAVAFVRALIADRTEEGAGRMRILYGGSVDPRNASELLALPDVDGALVGGASLQVESFLAIAAAATP